MAPAGVVPGPAGAPTKERNMAAKKPAAKPADPKAEAVVEDAPKPKYAENDNSIDARMWRLEQDHIRMGARPK